MDIPYRAFDTKEETYAYLLTQARAMLAETDETVSALANLSSALYLLLPRLNWAGFYLMKDGAPILGPFQGKPAVSRIALGSGVCGTAAQLGEAQVVQDVHACPNHIACDLSSRSEIVLPIRRGDGLFGVLDIDSPEKGRFDEEDLAGLSDVVRALEMWLGDAR